MNSASGFGCWYLCSYYIIFGQEVIFWVCYSWKRRPFYCRFKSWTESTSFNIGTVVSNFAILIRIYIERNVVTWVESDGERGIFFYIYLKGECFWGFLVYENILQKMTTKYSTQKTSRTITQRTGFLSSVKWKRCRGSLINCIMFSFWLVACTWSLNVHNYIRLHHYILWLINIKTTWIYTCILTKHFKWSVWI